jgi:hypothetical protein
MIGKIIALPFILVVKFFGLIVGIINLIFGIFKGTIGFAVTRVIGTFFGALKGFILGTGSLLGGKKK